MCRVIFPHILSKTFTAQNGCLPQEQGCFVEKTPSVKGTVTVFTFRVFLWGTFDEKKTLRVGSGKAASIPHTPQNFQRIYMLFSGE
ncbi:MAG: hypothetical protein IJW29_09920 [Clostridia bacterium]|nr:hypothetical protein [Clostridia bacterium]